MKRTSKAKSPGFEPAGQFCPDCTGNNLPTATVCEVCGAPLRGHPAAASRVDEPTAVQDDEGDDSLYAVPSDERASLGSFPSDSEADMAAGFLRSLGIAVEVASARGQGLPWSTLWVRRADADTAARLLEEVARAAAPGDTEAV